MSLESSLRRAIAWLTPGPAEPPGLRGLDPGQARAAVASFYMSNISASVVAAQRRVLERLAPQDVEILQVKTRLFHGDAMTRLMRASRFPTVVFLDIDCIPVRDGAVDRLIRRAEEADGLVGAAQRANHIKGAPHTYAGPFCMAMTGKTYAALGRPSFFRTRRSDVGEELTRIAEAKGLPVDLLWPTACEEPRWDLTDDMKFGLGTTYDDDFWHAFRIRTREAEARFIEKCNEVLSELTPGA